MNLTPGQFPPSPPTTIYNLSKTLGIRHVGRIYRELLVEDDLRKECSFACYLSFCLSFDLILRVFGFLFNINW